MSIYSKLYFDLCQDRKSRKDVWTYGSNIHRHHITPKHSGGTDDDENFTYLTVREHVIAHFLLWKIYRNPNDLRSMKMLGAELTFEQRKIIGLWCRDNKIGMFSSKYDDVRSEWGRNGRAKAFATAKQNSTGIFTANSELKSSWCRASGKLGGEYHKRLGLGIHNSKWRDSPEAKEASSRGGLAIRGMVCVTNGVHKTRIRPELLEEYLSKGYRRGFKTD